MSKEANIQNRLRDFLSDEFDKLVNYTRKNFGGLYFEAEPEDIVQDVALNLYSKLDINAPIENLASYFYRSLQNRITDLQRKKRKIISVENFVDEREENVLLKSTADDSPTLEDVLENEAAMDTLMKALDELNPGLRDIIMETEFEGKTFAQLSEELGVPIGTLLSRKHRAMAKLQEKLENLKNNRL